MPTLGRRERAIFSKPRAAASPISRGQGGFPLPGIFAALHDVFARCGTLADFNGAAHHVFFHGLGVFDHDHAVRAVRQDTAGGDAGTFTGIQFDIRRFIDGQGGGTFKVARVGFAGTEHIAGVDRESVHAGAGEQGPVMACDQVFGQHPAGGLGQIGHFGGQGGESLE